MDRDTQRLFCSTAIAYADMGLPVLPVWGVTGGQCDCGRRCRTPGKHPHGRFAPRGLKDATIDGAVICSWYSGNECPNLGIVMGNRFVAIDVDPRNGGDESLLELNLPRTATQQTGGGRHFIYRTDEPIASGSNKLGKGIDIKSDGGYIIAAPSVHSSGGVYKWLIDLRAGIAPLPAAIAARLARPKPNPVTVPTAIAGDRDRAIAAACLPLLGAERCSNYDGWLAVGMACYRSGLACDDWDQWSRTANEKYQHGACEAKWPTFATRADGVRSGSLVHWAAEDSGINVAALLSQCDPSPGAATAKPTQNGLALYGERLRRIEAGQLASLPLPWPVLEDLTRLGAPGRLTVIAGRQGAAKSFFALELLRFWLAAGIAVAAYLLEGDFGDLMDRTLAQASGNADVTDIKWQKANGPLMRQLTDEHARELESVAGACTVSEGLGLETLDDLAGWIESQAKAGKRALLVDPVSAAVRKGQPWVADPAFVRRVKRAARDYEATVLLVSHLAKGAEDGAVDKVAGGAAYGRFSDCVLQLIRHDSKASMVKQSCGRTELEHGQTVFIEKARARGTGLRLAYNMTPGLTFLEEGIICKRGKT